MTRGVLGLAALALLGAVLAACEETGARGEDSTILEDAPIRVRQTDETTVELEDTEALRDSANFNLQLPEAMPQGWTVQESLLRGNERVLDVSLAHNEGEALLRITWPVINVAGEETVEIEGIDVVRGEQDDTRVYNWTSCQQSYTLQTNDAIAADTLEGLVAGFINSCEDPVTPPEGS